MRDVRGVKRRKNFVSKSFWVAQKTSLSLFDDDVEEKGRERNFNIIISRLVFPFFASTPQKQQEFSASANTTVVTVTESAAVLIH